LALKDYHQCTKIDKNNINVLQSFAALQAKVGGEHLPSAIKNFSK
jgi:hypothetical protein